MQITIEKGIQDFIDTRQRSLEICKYLKTEDYIIQSMPDVSPPKWHLAHTTWFFETFILKSQKNYTIFHPQFEYLFNSYYKGLGKHHPREKRGLLSRPSLEEIKEYRKHVDRALIELMGSSDFIKNYSSLIELGIHHEEQHQELLLMDILHIFYSNPLKPVYKKLELQNSKTVETKLEKMQWIEYPAGLVEIGTSSKNFHFDNEGPKHTVFLQPYRLAHRLITNGEYLNFIQDGAYQNPNLWLSDGWDWVENNQVQHPLYWQNNEDTWQQMTLHGMIDLDLSAPVCHINFYEADAFARWKGKRLPTEFEWENAARELPLKGHFYEDHFISPLACQEKFSQTPLQIFGDVWEWTQSPYSPYPGFHPAPGAVGEYNGKFMCNQMVLRGGSCLSVSGHLRASYRNFFPPASQWQCSGLRLAEDIA